MRKLRYWLQKLRNLKRATLSQFRTCRESCNLKIAAHRVKARIKSGELTVRRVNLCGGSQAIPGYFSIDIVKADLNIDLDHELLPFPDNSLDSVFCMSAINYFSRQRGEMIVGDIFRALRIGGIVRMGVQDLQSIADRYVRRDEDFFFQKSSDGRERFEGRTFADKFNAWFYGYVANGSTCKYMYDFDTLALLFEQAGFANIKQKNYRESVLEHIELIDNRPDQMFYLEAEKK